MAFGRGHDTLGFLCVFFEGCVVWHSVQVQMAVNVMLSVLCGV